MVSPLPLDLGLGAWLPYRAYGGWHTTYKDSQLEDASSFTSWGPNFRHDFWCSNIEAAGLGATIWEVSC